MLWAGALLLEQTGRQRSNSTDWPANREGRFYLEHGFYRSIVLV
jgi:hypothetical protein